MMKTLFSIQLDGWNLKLVNDSHLRIYSNFDERNLKKDLKEALLNKGLKLLDEPLSYSSPNGSTLMITGFAEPIIDKPITGSLTTLGTI